MKKVIISFVFTLVSLYYSWCLTYPDIIKMFSYFMQTDSLDHKFEGDFWDYSEDLTTWKGMIILQQYRSIISPLSNKIMNRFNLDKTWNSALLQIEPNDKNKYVDHDTALSFFSFVKSEFGAPNRIIDYGLVLNSKTRQDLQAQWDIGSYELYLYIMDIGFLAIDKPGINGMYLEIIQKGNLKDIVPFVGMNIKFLSGTSYLGLRAYPLSEQTIQAMKSITLVLDYNYNDILDSNLYPVGKINSITDGSIDFYIGNGKSKTPFLLDRLSGDVTSKIFSQNGEDHAEYYGKATRVNVESKLF
jgi:hypothetical protein